jgi:hypothetical protein
MRCIFSVLLIIIFLWSCAEEEIISSINEENWKKRAANSINLDSLVSGETYLSVYSDIYNNTEKEKILLGVTVSIKNPNRADTIFVRSAEYFDTSGQSLRKYINFPVFVAPMETIEIIINRLDREGGSGANFIFEWQKPQTAHEPFFESVMISANGNQGLSFTAQGYRIK